MHRPGDKVKVTYLRKKKEHTTTLTLRNEQGTTTNLETVDTESMGAALRALTDAEKNELGLKNGLVVSSIKAGKLQDAGITKGINHHASERSRDEFHARLRRSRESGQ